jgi:hypothetical protein
LQDRSAELLVSLNVSSMEQEMDREILFFSVTCDDILRMHVYDTETCLCIECRVRLHIDENALEVNVSLYALNLARFANN